MAITITSSKRVASKGGIKIGIHSEGGMGKTMLAATAPKPVIILTERTGVDCLSPENIEKVFKGKKGITKDVPVIEAYNSSDFEEAVNYVRESDEFETVIVDSVSELSKIRLKEELPNHKNMMQAYGMMALHIDELLRTMRDDPKNWIFLFHSEKEDVYDDEGNPSMTRYIPGFEGQKMQNEFKFLIGDIYCIVNEFDEEGEEVRKLRTRQGDTAHYAKNRRGRLDELEDMHIGRIFWKLKKKSARKKVRPKD